MRLVILTCLALALAGGPAAASATAQSGGYLLPPPPKPSADAPAPASCAYAAVGTAECTGEVEAGPARAWYDVTVPDAYGPVRILLSCAWNGEGGLLPCGV